MAIEYVSHTVASMIINSARALDVSLDELVTGTGLSTAELFAPRPRLHWDIFSVLVDRLVERVGLPAMQKVCNDLSVLAPAEMKIFAAFVAPRHLYDFINRIAGPTMYPMLRSRYTRLPGELTRLDMELRPGFRGCENFFRVNGASQAAIPQFIGLPSAEVQAECHARGASYLIALPESQTLVARLKRRFISPAAREVLAEVQRDKLQLFSVYQKLQETSDTLSQVLDVMPGAAFEVAPNEVRALNAAAVRSLQQDEGLARTIRAAVEVPAPGFQISPLGDGRFLVLRVQSEDRQAQQLRVAVERWSLTPRQSEVLDSLLRGATNKEVAQHLGCSVKTVERHLTELFRRAGVDSRLALLSAVWSSRDEEDAQSLRIRSKVSHSDVPSS